MVVHILTRNHRVTGLFVGSDNVRRYFPKDIPEIVLHLGHLDIQCDLAPDFWRDCPEIRDPRLFIWLEIIHLHRCSGGAAVRLAMIPVGTNAYRLQTLSAVELEEEEGVNGEMQFAHID